MIRAAVGIIGDPYLPLTSRKGGHRMKKLIVAIVPIGVFVLGSLGAIPADGTHASQLLVADNLSSIVPAGVSSRLLSINTQLYPDDPIVDDWLCDGMGPCIRLSREQD
ncbi:MAG: hypothetical protein M3P38_00990 [Chloroflexota bacterium]|nr:hypothetical protein [Chloroflexota bacterium]